MSAPGDLIHVDVKKGARITPGGGWRVQGRCRVRKRPKVDYTFLHIAVDDRSRAAYVEGHDDHHHTIGHSFLMRPKFDAVELRRVWNRQIQPLIEEYFFDQPDTADSFTLQAFWPAAAE